MEFCPPPPRTGPRGETPPGDQVRRQGVHVRSPPFAHANNNPFVNRAENSFLRFWNYHTVAIT